ncbi:MAG: RagB/SusD family nutrient uptake outer membrane protein [Bacteroidaceae bacterium]|nr:RagB/SusD family nutrient uptake outer membrane protein [Bacteroidaceae bacterium]
MKTKNIILCIIGLFAICSCDDMFEPLDENNRQEDAMYEESKYAYGLLMYGYDRLPYITTTQTDIATDDAMTNLSTSSYMNMATGTWASDNNPMSQWDNCKDGIQYVNLFLSKVEKVKWAPSAASKQQMFIDRLKGEAFGLRAIFYFYLLQAHGGYADDGVLYGVPLLTTPENGSSDFNQPRATFAECVKQCFADCDSAMLLLPADYEDIENDDQIPAKYQVLGAQKTGYNLVFGARSNGLVSGKIAEAVKGQVALLAASPAFREQSGVTSAEAATLCANVLKRIGGLEGFDNTGNVWYKNKTKLAPEASEMPEMLWREDRHKNAAQERENFPPTLFGNGRVNPSQNLVDAFPMRSGRPISDPQSGYDPQNPYVNRDPRLDDNVLYNGVTFRKTVIITGTYPNDKNETDDNLNSISTSTRTGYYLKKLLRDDVSPLASSLIEQQHIYPRIRYTEIFLAYAEAANDAWGPKSDPTGVGFTAYDVIKAIRERAGLATNEIGMPLPEGDAYLEECAGDQAKMTDLIRNERRLELCFENKRFWDLRRWMLPLNEPIKGMQIDLNKETGELTYTILSDVEERKYDSSYQWYGPIPKSEILKWSKLKQNKGWQ